MDPDQTQGQRPKPDPEHSPSTGGRPSFESRSTTVWRGPVNRVLTSWRTAGRSRHNLRS